MLTRSKVVLSWGEGTDLTRWLHSTEPCFQLCTNMFCTLLCITRPVCCDGVHGMPPCGVEHLGHWNVVGVPGFEACFVPGFCWESLLSAVCHLLILWAGLFLAYLPFSLYLSVSSLLLFVVCLFFIPVISFGIWMKCHPSLALPSLSSNSLVKVPWQGENSRWTAR